MLDLSDLLVFTKVVELKTLTAAARALGYPKSSISRRMSRLEEVLGVQLLQRSTRAVAVTTEGQIFFEYCLRAIGVIHDGQRALQDSKRYTQGVVNLALPYVLGEGLIGPLLAKFLQVYPHMKLITVLSDTPIELLRQGFDIALAVGPLAHSELVATKIGSTECGAFAAPGYLERKGAPQSHIELARFDLLALGATDRRQKWLLRSGETEVAVEFSAILACNDLGTLREAALAELGIVNLPAFMCKNDLAQGRLVEVLPAWRSADMTFFAMFPDPKAVPVRVRTLIDFLVRELRQKLSWAIDEDGRLPIGAHAAQDLNPILDELGLDELGQA
jgi:DNA-binding transcriptional LysR family regulator